VHNGGFPVANETDGLPNWREAPPVQPTAKTEP
jgi:enoyl-CoA hydratase